MKPENFFAIEKSSLDDKGWSLVKKQSQNLLNKLRKAGSPLGEYAKGKIYRGVLTDSMTRLSLMPKQRIV